MYLSRSQKTLITITSTANFICAHFIFFIWDQHYSYYAIIITASLLTGVILEDFKEAIPNTFISWITGSIISVGVLIAPAIIHGAERVTLDYLIISYGRTLGTTSLVVFPLILGVTTVGCYLSRVKWTHTSAHLRAP